jgi:hypothetical protein
VGHRRLRLLGELEAVEQRLPCSDRGEWGTAAASAKDNDVGLRATMRSSTAWNSALLPCRPMSPAYQTSSPTASELTCGPTASMIPAASKPRMIGSSEVLNPARVFTSAGLTETAITRTSTSYGRSVGIGVVTSCKLSGSSIGSPTNEATAVMEFMLWSLSVVGPSVPPHERFCGRGCSGMCARVAVRPRRSHPGQRRSLLPNAAM